MVPLTASAAAAADGGTATTSLGVRRRRRVQMVLWALSEDEIAQLAQPGTLADPVERLARADERYGGVGLAGQAAGHATRILRAAAPPGISDQVRAVVAAQHLAQAAWCAFDAAEPLVAASMLARARQVSAGVPRPLAQRLHRHLVHLDLVLSGVGLAHTADSRRGMLAAAAAARDGAGRAPIRYRALLAVHTARVRAYAGQTGEARRLLRYAHRTLDQAARMPVPLWLAWFDQPALDMLTARVYLAAGLPDDAAAHARQAVRTMPASRVRDRAHSLLTHAHAQLAAHAVDEAVRAAHTALRLAGHLHQGLLVGRAAIGLHQLRTTLGRRPEATAMQWINAYDTAAARAAMIADIDIVRLAVSGADEATITRRLGLHPSDPTSRLAILKRRCQARTIPEITALAARLLHPTDLEEGGPNRGVSGAEVGDKAGSTWLSSTD
ncbi:hypothetical protein C1I95_08865 [Micromonospora craterilacus]|uniref:Uncharacterized protein n=1 Tax=Micromonospora craterilacus TaxID=1655439 RepID=A0A2W2EE77_9ACTN|nr:hypothetical protein [Micromonospora craterilacus]PZG20743.1 hypothetical protein C1I95_08865 [Micromonospora craterilacus]